MHAMQMSAAGLAMLAAEEGEVLTAYRDVAGRWTIGIGLTAASGVVQPAAGMTITRAESRRLLALALARNYEPAVAAALPGAAQHAFDGGVSFHFNTGAIGRASWVDAWKAGDRAAVRAKLCAWNRAGGKVVAGLTARRNREADLILDGRYPGEAGAGETVLGRDSRGEAVAALQRDLARLGLYAEPIDGDFGAATETAVRTLQRAHPDLTEDGKAGPATRAQIRRLLDLAAATTKTAAGTAAGGAAALAGDHLSGPAVDAAGGLPLLLLALGAVGALLLALLAWRHRRELVALLRLARPNSAGA